MKCVLKGVGLLICQDHPKLCLSVTITKLAVMSQMFPRARREGFDCFSEK